MTNDLVVMPMEQFSMPENCGSVLTMRCLKRIFAKGKSRWSPAAFAFVLLCMNHYTAKRLTLSLLQSVREHEERFGVIELDVSKRLLQPQAEDGNDNTEAKQ